MYLAKSGLFVVKSRKKYAIYIKSRKNCSNIKLSCNILMCVSPGGWGVQLLYCWIDSGCKASSFHLPDSHFTIFTRGATQHISVLHRAQGLHSV